LVLETLISVAGRSEASFYRTSAGAEIDLVIEAPGQRPIAIEVKRSTAPGLGRGFQLACDDIGATLRAVIHGGSDAFPLSREVEAVPAADAAAWLSNALAT